MSRQNRPLPTLTTEELLRLWSLALRAENRSPHTIKSYVTAVRQLSAYASGKGFPLEPARFSKEVIREWLADVASERSPATAQTRYDAIRACYKWLDEEGELQLGQSPMLRVKRPHAPEPVTQVLSVDQVRSMLATCDRRRFVGARDRALILLLLDIGPRVGGVVGMRCDDVDLTSQMLKIRLKGGRQISLPFGNNTALELQRYLRLRRQHSQAALPYLWLGLRGRLSDSGVRQMLASRGERARVGMHVHPHMFRHTFAHLWKQSEGKDDELVELAGWTSGRQLQRYGRVLRAERAVDAHRRHSPGDQL